MPCEPLSQYGVSKLNLGAFCSDWPNAKEFATTSFRMFSIYGPGQNLRNLTSGNRQYLLAYLLNRKAVPVTGSLDRFRDFALYR